MPDALAQGLEPQTLLERIDMTEDGHQPALMQSGNDLPTPCAMAAQAGQHAHFDLVPCRFAPGLASLWAKRHHYYIGPQKQRRRHHLEPQRLLGGQLE